MRADRRRCSLVPSVLVMAIGLIASRFASAQNVQPGLDIFTTPAPPAPATTSATSDDFSAHPIPGGFFCPGSPSFTGTVYYKGLPFTPYDIRWRTTDTVVRRLATANLPSNGSQSTIPI